ncbi:unnamed protein product [Hermetia illucens]|uniref:CCC domain-containing protein n=1 Tax=Hermetia illucens TaxID=343691 RepID=A0A7R8UR53_HERIL|nr:uncharacterized protein LOC119652273 [Hermetia illucens]CAD7085220.1 unnamed protein product [Hermetia illucens]
MTRILFVALVVLSVFSQVPATSSKLGRVGKQLELLRQYDDPCPLCDASVYSYCSYKMAHDACCCTGQYGLAVPPQCNYRDCRLLYAKSCFEHQLITKCCCERP